MLIDFRERKVDRDKERKGNMDMREKHRSVDSHLPQPESEPETEIGTTFFISL